MKLDLLNLYSVSIITIVDDKIHRKAYENSVRGREEIKNEISLPIQEQIFKVWGDKPLVEEIEF